VHKVTFTPVRFRREGYDQTEVDNFLDRVENQLRTNDEYAAGLLKLLQENGIMAPSRPEPAEPTIEALNSPTPEAPSIAAAPIPVTDPANVTLPHAS
jgi:DivIVA domain-containing protein